MCLIAWNWQPGSDTPLLLLANRDEFYARAALPMHWWPGDAILAGQDVQAGGTWLGVNRKGHLAALTNYRLPVNDAMARPSRGGLATGFLQGELDAQAYLEALAQESERYNPFNLLLYDGSRLMGLESRHKRVLCLQPGIGAVSNADFDTPWPKLLRLKAGLQSQCQARQTSVADLLPLLQDRTRPADAELPQTGVSRVLERTLSSVWIGSPHYGTRASSIVRLGTLRNSFFEQGYGEQGMLDATQHIFTP